jgi:hypothetical protein
MLCGLCGERGKEMGCNFVKKPRVVWAHNAANRICMPCYNLMNLAQKFPNDKEMLALFAQVKRPPLEEIWRLCSRLRSKRTQQRKEKKHSARARAKSKSAATSGACGDESDEQDCIAENNGEDEDGSSSEEETEDDEMYHFAASSKTSAIPIRGENEKAIEELSVNCKRQKLQYSVLGIDVGEYSRSRASNCEFEQRAHALKTIATLTARVAALEAALAAEQAKSADLTKGLGAYSYVLQQQFASNVKAKI